MRICMCVLLLLSPALLISTTTRLLRQRQLFDSHDIENISQRKKGLGLRRVLTKYIWFILTSKMYQKTKWKLEKKRKRFEWVVNLFMKQSKWLLVCVTCSVLINGVPGSDHDPDLSKKTKKTKIFTQFWADFFEANPDVSGLGVGVSESGSPMRTLVTWNVAIDNIFFVILSKLNFGNWLRNNAFS